MLGNRQILFIKNLTCIFIDQNRYCSHKLFQNFLVRHKESKVYTTVMVPELELAIKRDVCGILWSVFNHTLQTNPPHS